MITKAYKYRIYPNETQVAQVEQTFGAVRWIWNYALAKKTEAYNERKENLSRFTIQKDLVELKKKEETAWLRDVNAQSLQASLLNLDVAYKNFFKKTGRFPRFKTKRDTHRSFQCPQSTTFDFINNTISIPKIKNIEAVLHRMFEGKIKTVTISRTPTMKYYASVLVEQEGTHPTPPPITKDKAVGIDLGVKTLVVCSNGLEFANHRYLKKGLKRLRMLQKSVSRKVKGSCNRQKAVLKVAKLHEKIANQRLDNLHKITHRLTTDSEIQTICIEDLNVKGMLRNHRLAQAITDSAFGEFVRQLKYKCQWYGKNLVQCGRFEPSSKTCSDCGKVKDTLSLAERVFECECGLSMDRDLNASINVKNFYFLRADCPSKPVEKEAMVID